MPIQRTLNVLQYIKEVANLGRKIPFQVEDHNRLKFYEKEIVGLPGVKLDADPDNQVWLRIDRLQPEIPPRPQNVELATLVRIPNDPSKQPTLELQTSNDEQDGGAVYDDETIARLNTAFHAYLVGPHQAWVQKETPRRRTINLYASLFGLQQALKFESASDPVELIWGVGVGLWRTQEKRLRYPILLQSVEIDIDNRHRITISPRQTELQIDLSVYSAMEITGVNAVRDNVIGFLNNLECSFSPFVPVSFEGALHACVNALDPGGSYWEKPRENEAAAEIPSPEDNLRITNTWVLFVRPKTAHFLMQDIENLRGAVGQLEELPPGPNMIFADAPDEPTQFFRIPFRGISTPNPASDNGSIRDLYFPKPYNEEQVRIVERLEQSDGVVVQGPPGTGKTHTIANIICHYLANGKRVLVTSKGEQALRVLKEKLPADIQPLAISLLSSDRQGLEEMEKSVISILQLLPSLDTEQITEQIEAGRRRVDQICATVARIENELRDWAEKHLRVFEFRGQQDLVPAQLARMLLGEEKLHQWLPGPVLWQQDNLEIEDDKINRLRELRQIIGENLLCARWSLPELSDLPDTSGLENLRSNLHTLNHLNAMADNNGLPQPRNDFTPEGLKLSENLVEALSSYERVLRNSEQDGNGWLKTLWQIGQEAYSNHPDKKNLCRQLLLLFNDILQQDQTRTTLLNHPVKIVHGAESNAEFLSAIDRLAQGKPGFGLVGGLFNWQTNKYLKVVRLSNHPPRTQQEWTWVKKHIQYQSDNRSLVSRWNSYMEGLLNGPVFEDMQPDFLQRAAKAARQAKNSLVFAEKDYPYLRENLPKLFMGADGLITRINNSLDVNRYIEALRIHSDKARLVEAEQRQITLRRTLAQHDNPCCAEMLNIITELRTVGPDDDTWLARWQKCRQILEELHALRDVYSELRGLTSFIQAAGAPFWAKALLTEPAANENDSLLPNTWHDSFNWHRLMNYLETIDEQNRLRRLAADLRDNEALLARTVEKLVSDRIKVGLSKTKQRQKGALERYFQAIRKIGAGKGKVKTPRLRQEAQEAMKDAVGAVPCWIMPHWRVSETLPAKIGDFDLVIVDEASQSDIWALPALLRGQKILVVGDDKQVSPTVIGPNWNQLIALQNQFLHNFPLRAQVRPESSIYDLAKVAFVANNICLREHFRCVPPIIAFSDRHWYQPPGLLPLRIPKPEERIDPPLVDVLVKDGFRKPNDTNPAEAHAIVREIKELIENPHFSARSVSIGVISILGQGAQAKLIAELLFYEIGEENIRKHDIFCGDPPSFQGNEKNIIFLSMVDDTEHAAGNVGYFAGSVAAQRINVAASRAKDRMYLYRSFRRDALRNPNDVRAKLLDHFTNPMPQDGPRVAALRELCESDFEQRVYDALVSRGYRVIPQVPAGGFRIDLVAEGSGDKRLAIECDGAAYHPPAQYFADINRQRVLERMGWTFWRCWGAEFYRHPNQVLEDLFNTLARLGIEPTGEQSEAPPSLVEYREVCGLAESDTKFVDPETIDESPPQEDESITVELATDQPSENPADEDSLRAGGNTPAVESAQNNFVPDSAQQIEPPPTNRHEIRRSIVQLNDTVSYAFEGSDQVKTVQIVTGPNQPEEGIINVNSPIARALMGCETGGMVEVYLPTGEKTLLVLEIQKSL